MFEVTVEKTIACAHRLVDYDGPCEALHGHNYRIVVTYAGTELDRCGMLVDFTYVKKVMNAVLDQMDHTYLNELPAFETLSPSAENMAAYIYHEMNRTSFERAKLLSVAVYETPCQVAVYRE